MLDQLRLATTGLSKSASAARVIGDYVALTKPPIVLLLVITALGGMFLAARGAPSFTLMLLVCAGGALAAGGANAINHYLDRDIDELMSRTCQRPIPGRRIRPSAALAFGVVLNLAAFMVLASWVNPLAAFLALAATLFYVLVYTGWLKRSTPQNIVIGGAAGAMPPLVGWAAVTGGVEAPALFLFAIIFFWTPPHFWALALLIQRDYEQAGIPMLPVVSGREHTVLSILVYSSILVAISLVFAATNAVGWVYLGAAVLLGGVFMAMAHRLRRTMMARHARGLYLYSLLYLALLFAAMMVDSAVRL